MTSPDAGGREWTRERAEEAARRACDPTALEALLADARGADPERVGEALRRARAGSGLSLPDAALLLLAEDPALRAALRAAAREVHERAFSRRVGILAPVCPTNRCVNDCLYCPLRRSNLRLRRTHSGTRDLQREIVALLDEGYRHVLLVFGEDRSGLPYIRDSIWGTYGTRSGLRQVLRVDVNLNPLRAEELGELSEAARLGTYAVYQETYHPEAYRALHPDGPKASYLQRLTCHDVALSAGATEVGLGVLLGAYDWRFDVLAVLGHAAYLEDTYGQGPRTLTYPRMVAAPEAPASRAAGAAVSDEDFCHLIAVTRLARPCTDLVLCTPAPREVRRELYTLGISQVSVGSSSYPGAYSEEGDAPAVGNLRIGRPRALEDLVYRMCEWGLVPNFCVACYAARTRSGPRSRGCVDERCGPNALLALQEYLLDHASPATQAVGEHLLQAELARLPEQLRSATLDLMEEVESGLRRVSL